MKFARYGPPNEERPAVIDKNGKLRDLSQVVDDITGATLAALPETLKDIDPAELPLVDESCRLGPPLTGVGKFIGIGLNYSDHAAETSSKVPQEPLIFMKATSCICGPNDDIETPQGAYKLDWEVELGLVIGRHAKNISEEDALDYLGGYLAVMDVSERSFQKERSGQWTKGKSADTFGPIGPWLVTRDEIGDPQNLNLWLELNSKRRQDGNTSSMVFPAATLIAYLSNFMSLHPGDIIATGTPPGVGVACNPPEFLQRDDRVRLSVQGLGIQTHIIV